MRVVLFCHSIASCWNHGNVHFLRGVVRELLARGHGVRVLEPEDGWSRANLVADAGAEGLERWRTAFPELPSATYGGQGPDLDEVLSDADLVLVHEWTDPALIRAIGRRRARGGRFLLLFHDTHHRAVSEPDAIGRLPLDDFDGVLAFGRAVAAQYERRGWGRRVRVWHEAADTSVFYPRDPALPRRDLVWVGNWGDGERSAELRSFLLEPVRRLGLTADVHGVRYPPEGLAALAESGARFRGWLPNHEVPDAFAAHRVTVHVPRRPYVAHLPGIPTIRVFEALACGIPLVSAPWDDAEGLFEEGCFLEARDGDAMIAQIGAVLADADLCRSLVEHGLAAIRDRHSCAHRVDELLAIHAELGARQNRQAEVPACA